MAEAMGRTPPASRYSADMSKHAYLGSDPSLRPRTSSSPNAYDRSVPRTPSIGARRHRQRHRLLAEQAAGADVLCLEQWALGHDRGASEDHSRIIRLGYHAARLHSAHPRTPTRRGR